MARLFGFIGNQSELGPKVLQAHSLDLRVKFDAPQAMGWGVGFYQFGEVLLRRRHLDHSLELDPGTMTRDVKSEVLIGHVRKPTVGNLRTENTHPFRYREWLFAQIGTPASFAEIRTRLLEELPSFLRSNVRGDTDSEVLFHLVLSCLLDQGQFDTLHASAKVTAEALRKALRVVNEACKVSSVATYCGDILLTNGERILAVHQSEKMAYRLVDSAEEVQEYLAEGSERVPHASQTQCCVVASEVDTLPERWVRVPNNSLLTLSPTEPPAIEPLDL
jgi:predicted glutamine amidotransferase